MGSEEVDPEVVDHLDHAKRFHLDQHQGKKDSVQLEHRLGGLEAAAFALLWLEEGSNNGLHFDQAFVEFMVLLFFHVFSSSEL